MLPKRVKRRLMSALGDRDMADLVAEYLSDAYDRFRTPVTYADDTSLAPDSRYVLKELNGAVDAISKRLEAVEALLKASDLANYMNSTVNNSQAINNLKHSANTLGSQMDAVKDAIIALTAKLDDDAAEQNASVVDSSLDEDYETTIVSKLK